MSWGREHAAVTLTLDRPARRNALSVALRDAISDTMDTAVTAAWVERICVAPREVLVCAKAEVLARARFAANATTLEM